MNFFQSLSVFFDYRYLFDLRPIPLGPSLVGSIFVFFSWFVVLAILVGAVGYIFRKEKPLYAKIAYRFSRLFSMTGLGGLLLLFFTYEQTPIFQMRFWVMVLFVLFIAQLINIAIYIIRDYPHEKARLVERERFEKYLPGRKS